MYLHKHLQMSITTESKYPLNYIKYLEDKFKYLEECHSKCNIIDVNFTSLFLDF